MGEEDVEEGGRGEGGSWGERMCSEVSEGRGADGEEEGMGLRVEVVLSHESCEVGDVDRGDEERGSPG